MVQEAEAIEARALEEIARAADPSDLEEIRIRYMGKNGDLTRVLRSVGKAEPRDRPRIGQRVNQAKKTIGEALEARRAACEAGGESAAGALDVTLPGRPPPMGSKHPLTLIREEVTEIFRDMGFSVVDGPEVEWDYYNFEALNIPRDHPARDTQDTFYSAATSCCGPIPLRCRSGSWNSRSPRCA